MTQPLALTLTAAAQALSVSPRTVRRLLDAGALQRVQIGRAVRVSTASVHAYVAQQSAGGAGVSVPENPTPRGILRACPSATTPTDCIGIPAPRSGGRASPTPEASALADLLARRTSTKPLRS
ncbi:MAG: DNA-binding protein [Chromatiaceae bacterium]|nr:MAG: DNA-binding protein [Chromatiaceae bacterium]